MKKIIIVLILLCILISPFVLLSNWGLGIVENYIGENSKELWTADWQWRIAYIYSHTFREEKAIKAYDNFMKRYPSDNRCPDAKFNKAYCLQKIGPRDVAIAEFNEFIEWYPDHPNVADAKKRITALKYGAPN